MDRAGKRRNGADEGREGSASVTEEGDRQGKGDSTERERGDEGWKTEENEFPQAILHATTHVHRKNKETDIKPRAHLSCFQVPLNFPQGCMCV